MSYLGRNLVFIISQPKAGSTLLQRLLAGHPDVQTSAETWLMLHPMYGMRKTGIRAHFNANWAATGVSEFLEHYADGEDTYVDGIRCFAQAIYGRVLEKHDKRLFVDKTPRYTMIIDELYRAFPEAKYILLIRNPLAILKSELHTYIGEEWPKLSNFRPDLVDAPGRLVAARKTLGAAAFEVRYEDLVIDTESIVTKLCDFIGIDFETGMLDYSDTPAPVGRMNDPVGIHRHTSTSAESLDKWKELGADTQLREFALGYLETLGEDVIDALGYSAGELRTAIEQTAVTRTVSPVFPWRLAILPRHRWGLREHLRANYIAKAQQGSRLKGLASAVKLLWRRGGGGIGRLTSAE